MEEQGRVVEACASASTSVVVEDKGDVFNSDLTQALELGLPARARRVHGRRRPRAQGEPRRARATVRLSRIGTTRTSFGTRSSRWADGGARARLEAGHDHEVAARRAGLLMRRLPLATDRSRRSRSPRAAAARARLGQPGRRRGDADRAEAGKRAVADDGQGQLRRTRRCSLAGDGGSNHRDAARAGSTSRVTRAVPAKRAARRGLRSATSLWL